MRPTATTPRLPPSTPASLTRSFAALALALAASVGGNAGAIASSPANAHANANADSNADANPGASAALRAGPEARADAAAPHAGYDPPRQVSRSAAADPSALLRQVLPAGSALLHPPQQLPFGAYEKGTLLVFSTAVPPRGLAVWYLTAAEEPDQLRLIRLRDPEPADGFIDVQVRDVFSVGTPGDQHIVLLDSASRAAPAGGQQQWGGSVWRRVGGSAQRLDAESRRLTGVPDAQAARTVLAPLLRMPTPSLLPGALPAVFLSLPVDRIDLTHRERLERVSAGSRWLQLNDPPNGYLEIRGDAGLAGYSLALFRPAAKGEAPVVALQRRYTEGQHTWFLQRAGSTWRDVSADLVPGYQVNAAYTLPQRGTTVQRQGQPALHWTGAAFATR